MRTAEHDLTHLMIMHCAINLPVHVHSSLVRSLHHRRLSSPSFVRIAIALSIQFHIPVTAPSAIMSAGKIPVRERREERR